MLKNPVLALLKFAGHAVFGMIGVSVITAILTFTAVRIVHRFVSGISPKLPNVLLTEIPGFPLQIVVGLLLGYAMWRLTKQRLVFWAWVPPVALLLAMVVRFVSIAGGGSILQSLEHFLGAGCSLKQHCLDQVIYTFPSVAATSYSAGAFVASYMSRAYPFTNGNRIPPPMEIRS